MGLAVFDFEDQVGCVFFQIDDLLSAGPLEVFDLGLPVRDLEDQVGSVFSQIDDLLSAGPLEVFDLGLAVLDLEDQVGCVQAVFGDLSVPYLQLAFQIDGVLPQIRDLDAELPGGLIDDLQPSLTVRNLGPQILRVLTKVGDVRVAPGNLQGQVLGVLLEIASLMLQLSNSPSGFDKV